MVVKMAVVALVVVKKLLLLLATSLIKGDPEIEYKLTI